MKDSKMEDCFMNSLQFTKKYARLHQFRCNMVFAFLTLFCSFPFYFFINLDSFYASKDMILKSEWDFYFKLFVKYFARQVLFVIKQKY